MPTPSLDEIFGQSQDVSSGKPSLDELFGVAQPVQPQPVKPKSSTGTELAKFAGRGALGTLELVNNALMGASDLGGRAIGVNPENNTASKLFDTAAEEYGAMARGYAPSQERDVQQGRFQPVDMGLAKNEEWAKEHPITNFGGDLVEGAIPYVAGGVLTGGALPVVAGLSTQGKLTHKLMNQGMDSDEAMLRSAPAALTETALFGAMHHVKNAVMGSGLGNKFMQGSALDLLAKPLARNPIVGELAKPAGNILQSIGREAAFVSPYLTAQGEAVQAAELGGGAITQEEYNKQHGYDPNAGLGTNALNVAKGLGKGLATNALVGAGFGITGALAEKRAKIDNAKEEGYRQAQEEFVQKETAIATAASKDVVEGKQAVDVIGTSPTLDEIVRQQSDNNKREVIQNEVDNNLQVIDQLAEGAHENLNSTFLKTELDVQNGSYDNLASEIRGKDYISTHEHKAVLRSSGGRTGSELYAVDVKGEHSSLLKNIASTLGKKVVFYDSQDSTAPDGFTNPSRKDTLYVSARSKAAPLFILGHETLHSLRQREFSDKRSTPKYDALVKDIIPFIDKAKYKEVLERAQKHPNYDGLDNKSIHQELMANLMGELFVTPDAWHKMHIENPSLFKKLGAVVLDIINKIVGKKVNVIEPVAKQFINNVKATHEVLSKYLLDSSGYHNQLAKDASHPTIQSIAKSINEHNAKLGEGGSAPIAPEYLVNAAKKVASSVKTLKDFTVEMVRRFGESIKQHVVKLYEWAKSKLKDTRGLVGKDIDSMMEKVLPKEEDQDREAFHRSELERQKREDRKNYEGDKEPTEYEELLRNDDNEVIDEADVKKEPTATKYVNEVDGHNGEKGSISPKEKAARIQERRFNSLRSIDGLLAKHGEKIKEVKARILAKSNKEKEIRKANDVALDRIDEQLSRNKLMSHDTVDTTTGEATTSLKDLIIEDLRTLSNRYEVDSLVDFIKKDEGIKSLAALKSYPDSLMELMDHFKRKDALESNVPAAEHSFDMHALNEDRIDVINDAKKDPIDRRQIEDSERDIPLPKYSPESEAQRIEKQYEHFKQVTEGKKVESVATWKALPDFFQVLADTKRKDGKYPLEMEDVSKRLSESNKAFSELSDAQKQSVLAKLFERIEVDNGTFEHFFNKPFAEYPGTSENVELNREKDQLGALAEPFQADPSTRYKSAKLPLFDIKEGFIRKFEHQNSEAILSKADTLGLVDSKRVDVIRSLIDKANNGNQSEKNNAKSMLFDELLDLKKKIAQKEIEVSEIVNPKYFENQEKAFNELGLSAAQHYKLFLDAGGDKGIYHSQLYQKLEQHYQSKADSLYERVVKGNKPEDIRDYVASRLNESDRAMYDRVADGERVKRGNVEVPIEDTLPLQDRMRFTALRDVEANIRALGNEVYTKASTPATTKFSRQVRPNIEDYYQAHEAKTDFEKSLGVESVGKLKSPIAQKFYDLIAKAFGADLVVVSDPNYRSRYIGRAEQDGRSKLVINANSKTSFARLYAHELFHHVVRKALPHEYQAFKDSVKFIVGEEKWNAAISDMQVKAYPEHNVVGSIGEFSTSNLNAYPRSEVLKGIASRKIATDFTGEIQEGHKVITARDATRAERDRMIFDSEMNDPLTGKRYDAFTKKPVKKMTFTNDTEFASLGIKQDSEWKSEEYKRGIKAGELPEGKRNVLEEELLGNVFEHAVTQKAFYEHLSESLNGKGIAARLLKGLIDSTTKLHEVFSKDARDTKTGFSYEKDVLIKHSELEGIFELIGDLLGSAYKSTKFNSEMSNEMFWTDVQSAAKEGKEFVSDKLNKLKESDKKGIMNSIEELASKALNWIKEKKPLGMYADFMADPAQVTLASKLMHGVEFEAIKAQKQAVDKFKDAWKHMDEKSLQELHDNVVRKGIDVTTPEGLEAARKLNLTDEQVQCLSEYKNVSDAIFERLKAIYPDLEKVESHYGQSIKWYRENGTILDDSFDWVVNPETSKLEGKKQFLKMMDKESTTEELMAKHKISYNTINPHELFMQYVRDANKLLKLKEMVDSGLDEGHIIVSSDQYSAAKKGFFPISDNSSKIFQKINPTTGWKLVEEDSSFVKNEAGHDLQFANKEQAEEFKRNHPTPLTFEEIKPDFNTSFGDTEAMVSRMYFKKDLANMIDIILAPDRLRNNSFFGISGEQVMKIKNEVSAVEFAVSLFHAMTIGQEMVASSASHNIQRYEGQSLGGKLKGYNPVKAMKESREITAIFDAILGDTDLSKNEAIVKKMDELLGTHNVDALDVIKQFFDAGGLYGMDESLRGSAHDLGEMRYSKDKATVDIKDGDVVIGKQRISGEEILSSIKDVWEKESKDSKIKGAWNTGRFTVYKTMTSWLMEEGIPKIKMATFAKEYTLKLDTNAEKIKAGEVTKEQIARDTMKFIDDRFGEVNWKNMWMKPSIKTALQFAFRSFTWFTGSWKALSKAGIDIGKLGWYTAKGEKYELTEKGWWGINALITHFLTAGLVTTAYKAIQLATGQEEVPTDEETPALTRMLFPRVDSSDPTKRVSIPSYVSEAYKIMLHLGMLGAKAEPSKLVSGRFNSILGKGIELYNNEDFRGVTIRNSDDNVAKQAMDTILHIIPKPIMLSTIATSFRDKGMNVGAIATSSLGMTDAPAAAKRSIATNTAFEERRKEYKGKAITSDQMDEKDALKRAMYAYQNGDKSKIDELLHEGKISTRQYNIAMTKIPRIGEKENPKYKDQLSQAIQGLTVDGALKVWKDMSDNEKAKHKGEVMKKYMNMMGRQDKSPEEKAQVKQQMKGLGLI